MRCGGHLASLLIDRLMFLSPVEPEFSPNIPPPSFSFSPSLSPLPFIPPSLSLLRPPPHQDHDRTQEEVLRHQASVSQLKRSFMEAAPPSVPQTSPWESRFSSSSPASSRLTSSSPASSLRLQRQQAVGLNSRPERKSDLKDLSATSSHWNRPCNDEFGQ